MGETNPTPSEVVQAAEDAGFGESTLSVLRQNAARWADCQRAGFLADAAADCLEVAQSYLMIATEPGEAKLGVSVLAGATSLLSGAFSIADFQGDFRVAQITHAAMKVLEDTDGVEEALGANNHHQFTMVPWVDQVRGTIAALRSIAEVDTDA